MALLAAVGPMGLGAIDYALHCDRRPSLLVVTDIDEARLQRAQSLYTIQHARECGVELHYVNTGNATDPVAALQALSGGQGYDDVICFAPVRPVVEQADVILATDGCLNFFAGPGNTGFSAMVNFYNVHYNRTHVAATSHGNTDDMRAAVKLIEEKKVQAAKVVTHILGLNAAGETTLELPAVGGGKKLVYTGKYLPLTSLTQIQDQALAAILARHQGIWSGEAEQYLLAHAEAISHD